MTRQKRLRSGYGLLDTLAILTATGLVLTLATMVLGQAFTAHQSTLKQLQKFQNLTRMQRQMREDCAKAQEIILDAEANEIRMQFTDDQVIAYQPRGNELVRSHWRDAQLQGVESWEFRVPRSVSWSVESANTGYLVACRLDAELTTDSIYWVMRAGTKHSEASQRNSENDPSATSK